MTKPFRELCDGKMSVALRAMVDGLREQDAREDFQVDMDVWTYPAGDVCFGCAASCAAQKLAGVDCKAADFVPEYMLLTKYAQRSNRSEILSADVDDLDEFEQAVNKARRGWLQPLADYLRPEGYCEEKLGALSKPRDGEKNLRFYLTNENWREQLPAVEELIEDLEKEGW